MLRITNDFNHAHLVKVFREARTLGRDTFLNLIDRLRYLHKYAGPTNRCELGYDWAPMSFSFVMFTNGRYWMNGGLIYSGGSWGVHT